MIERIARIGTEAPLSAILCEPAQRSGGRPVVLILNSGVMHHVGSCRLSVLLARYLATHSGIASVRFDFSGVGDSPPRRSTASIAENHRDEIQEVMDYCQELRGANRFVVFGLCSGAHDALEAAAHDARVVGIVQVDGWCFPTWRSYLREYGPKLISPAAWGRRLRALVPGRRQSGAASELSGEYFEVPDFGPDLTRDRVARDLGVVVDRGVEQLSIFVGVKLECNYPGQYLDCFRKVDFGELLELHYWPNASHILVEPEPRGRVIEATASWLDRVFGDPVGPGGRSSAQSEPATIGP